ncbi:transcription factor bHLH123-like, partial [Sesamum indicum]|uniref:Transcription factor bHLH123-like n=1 Tax=Sesamum indicum TaxID=4182 RepID=A0A8M8V5R8_SESIN
MADDQFQLGGGNWWDTSRNRFDSSGTTPTSISTTLNAIASFGWPTEMVDTKSRSSMDSATPSSAVGHGGVLANQNLQMMGLGLSSQSMDWNPALFRGEKGESSFRALLQEDMSSNSSSFQQESGATAASQEHWRHKLYSGASSEDSSVNINPRGFSLDQPQFSSQASSNDSTITSQTGFQVDSSAAYGLLLSENQHHSAYPNRPMNYPYPPSTYGGVNTAELVPSWNKYPQFLRTSPPKQAPPQAAGS